MMFKDAYYDYINNTLNMYKLVENKNIITIDNSRAKCLDNAFSIEKIGNEYILDVYVSDVVSFLNYNREIASEAYDNGKSRYIPTSYGYYRIPMLPEILCDSLLSLNANDYKNVIHFTFIINDIGKIINHNIGLSTMKVNYPLSEKEARFIMYSDKEHPLYKDLNVLKELTILLYDHYKWSDYKRNMIKKIESVPSILVNYIVAKNANLAIYKTGKGYYTKQKTISTHSSTPLRRFASDINLGLYLYQYKLGNINDRDIYKVEDNFQIIIDHLNTIENFDNHINKILVKK